MEKKVFSLREIAERFNVKTSLVRKMLEENLFPVQPKKFGTHICWPISQIEPNNDKIREAISQFSAKKSSKKNMYTAHDLLVLFDISRSTLNDWIKKAQIPLPKTIDRRLFWQKDEIDELLAV